MKITAILRLSILVVPLSIGSAQTAAAQSTPSSSPSASAQRDKEDKEKEKEREREARDRAREEARARARIRVEIDDDDLREIAERIYTQARNAIERGQYERAVNQLDSLISRFDGKPGGSDPANRVDAALYWKAYSEAKQRQVAEALATVERIQKQFADSRWLKDAMALAMEIRQSVGQAVSPDSQPDDELKLLALRGVMQSDPDRAVAKIEEVLAGNSSVKVKENALFVLTQSRSPRAQEIVLNLARNGSNPDLQLKAIRYVGAMRIPNSGQVLEDAYKASRDVQVKMAIIRSFTASSDRVRLVNIAADQATSDDLREEAIRQLGAMKSDDELVRLYARESSSSVKKRIIHGLFISKNAPRLIEMARAEKDPELKREIVQNLSNMHSKEATDYLMELLK